VPHSPRSRPPPSQPNGPSEQAQPPAGGTPAHTTSPYPIPFPSGRFSSTKTRKWGPDLAGPTSGGHVRAWPRGSG
jgi:hypothetical protein